MKRADKEHLKKVIIVLLIASMLLGSSQVPQMPQVKVVAWAYDDIDLLNTDMEESPLISDTMEEDLLQSDTSDGITKEGLIQPDTAGNIPEEDVLLPDTYSDSDLDDIEIEDGVQGDSVISTTTIRGFRNSFLGTLNTAGTTLNDVSYIDEHGDSQTCTSANALSGNETELTPGWYVVNDDIEFDHSVSMNGQGDYHIILTDGKTMKIGESEYNGIYDGVGLGCAYDNDSKSGINLTIYGQQGGTGALEIYNGYGSPDDRTQGEIVGDGINVDNITFNGGKVVLKGGASKSYEINARNITINGGSIVASGTTHAINCTGNISINGGELTAKAETNSGTYGINCTGDITINGGTVNATAKWQDGYAINSGGDITINGGNVTATATGTNGYAIYTTAGKITINGGTIIAKAPGSAKYAINSAGDITIKDGNITADTVKSSGDITIDGGEINVTTPLEHVCGIEAGDDLQPGSNGKLTINNGEVTATAKGENGHALKGKLSIIINGGTVTANAVKDNRGESGHALYSHGNITISGNVTATATGDGGHVINSEADIIINGGVITAKAGSNIDNPWDAPQHSGCGLNAGGNITVNGGDITAEATDVADVDGNAVQSDTSIFINGGKIKAIAHQDGGSGMKAYQGDITINDGEVLAEAKGQRSDMENFGIKASGQININGGKVAARGSNAGIKTTGAGNGLSLSWKNLTDYVSTNSFSIAGNVSIATGKAFIDNNENFYIPANAYLIKGLNDVKLSATDDSIYTVSFDCGGYTSVPAMQLLKEGSKVTVPEHPATGDEYGGLKFAGWYQDAGCQIKYDFNSGVTSNLYLHAKWANKSTDLANATVKIVYRYTGNNIEPVVFNNVGEELTKGSDYTYTCKKEGSNTNVTMKDPGFYSLTVTGTDSNPNHYTDSQTVRVCVLTFEKCDPSTLSLNSATLPEGKDAAVVTASTVTMNSGWYVVTEDVKVESRMVVKGDVHLVLCDGTTLDATGNNGTMGISVTEGNSLTIYSQAGNTGKLMASSNEVNWYAGIGGDAPNDNRFPYLGQNKNAGNITIHGGEIFAKGSHDSAAIGMADEGKGGKITIYGGKITAERFARTGASATDNDTGIGGRDADIHIAWCRNPGDFILSDGYKGSVTFGQPYIIENSSTIVKQENINQAAGKKIVPTDSFETYTVSFNSNGGSAVETQTIARGKKARKPVTPIKPGSRFGGWYKDAGLNQEFNFDSDTVGADLTLYAKWSDVGEISYIGANGTVDNFSNYSPMEDDYTELSSGYYYVDKDVSLLNRIKVKGNVSLILGDDKMLIAGKGISVMDEENTLNIFGQSGGTGVLSANAAENNAAIGGDGHYDSTFGGSVGNINIYGGIIRPQGGEFAASIGGGRYNRSYGRICIYGGTISGQNGPAIGGKHGSAIGGGQVAPSEGQDVTGTVEIRGGKITVNGNLDGTGIGGGEYSCGGEISILGGQVYVGEYLYNGIHYPGIGDGDEYTNAKKAQITLGCREGQDDFIYSDNYRGNVRVAPNHALKIKDTDTTFQGNISDRVSEIAGKTLVFGHVHKLTYTVNESTGTVTATCENDGCDLPGNPHTATLTLSAPSVENLVYDGTEKPVTVIDEHSISGDAVVKYEKKTGDTLDNAAELTNPPKDAGTYRASITLADTGHDTATVSVDYTIRKRNVTITGLSANSKIYDDTTTASVNDTAKALQNAVVGDDVTIIPGKADFATADVGENITVTFTDYSLGGTASGNYEVSQPESMSANIAKRPVTIKANDQTVQFREAIKRMDATCDQGILVNRGHALTGLYLTPNPDPRYTSETVENGTISANGAVIKRGDTDVTNNYDITYVSGNLKIIMIRAKVIKPPKAKTDLKYLGRRFYNNIAAGQPLVDPGEAETKMEYNIQWISRGDGTLLKNADGTNVCDNPAPTEGYTNNFNAWMAGTYNVWYRAAADNSHAPSEPLCISVNMARAPLTVKVVDETHPYGVRFPSMNAIVDGLMDSVEAGEIGSRVYYYLIDGVWKKATDIEPKMTTTYPDLGTYPVKVNYEGDNYVRDCYKIDSIPGFLYVVPRTVSLNWADTAFTFNGQPQVPTVALTNLSNNEVPGAVGVTVSGAKVNAGHYTAAAVALTGDKAAKYALPSENTIDFSIAKADYSGNIPNVEVSVPVSADFFTASVAGKMPQDAGELTYERIRTISTNGFTHKDGGIKAKIDQNGLVTVSINRNIQNNIVSGNKLFICPDVDSTNYNTKSITVEATFVEKRDAGVRITQGNSLSVNYGEVTGPTLEAVADNPGTNAAWTWESSNTEVATITGSGDNCNVTIKGVGTAAITARYDSDTATGYATMILTVDPISVPIPVAVTGLIYDGAQKTGVAADNTHYTLTGEKGTLPGDYVATVTLTDSEHCRWSDGTIDVKFIPWTIEKQPGPPAPTGLTGISPTTLKNLDGKITGVDTNMEYSKDAAFGEAFPCTGTEIVGLTPGTYYVRIMEKETFKAGDAVAVEIEAVAPPVVRAREGLSYTGSPQVLVETDPIPAGTLWYAVTDMGDPVPSAGQYTTTIPTGINAGQYTVWYQIRGAGENPPAYVYVNIEPKETRNDLNYTFLSVNGLFGAEGMVDFSQRIPAGEHPRIKYYPNKLSDDWEISANTLTVDTVNKRIHYNAKAFEDITLSDNNGTPIRPTSENLYMSVPIHVESLQNYTNFNITVKINFSKECPTNHANKEQIDADHYWCHDCHGIFEGRVSTGGGGGGGGAPIDDTGYAVNVTNGTGTGSYEPGSSVAIRADEPEEGKHFKEWEGADDLIFTTGSKTTANAVFTMPEREVNLRAVYEELSAETYTVTVTDDGHGIGSAYPDYGKSGTKVSLLTQASEGYKFKEWQVISGNIIIKEDSFIIGEENVIIKAVFEKDEDHIHEYTSVVTKEPTCTEKGLRTLTCECGDSYTEDIPALGHDYAGEITKDPTTEADGEKTYTCKRCGHSYTEVLPKLSDSLLLYEKVKGGYEIRVSKKLLVGKGFTLVPKFASGKVVNERVVWESTNPDVATVTQDGKVKAMSSGDTTVFVRSEENPELTAYCIITVNEPVTKITLDKSRVRFGRGEKATLTAELLPYTAQQKLVWSTANASIVILCDEKGDELPGTMNGKKKIYNETGSKTVYVKAVGAGSAKVTAMAVDGSGKKSSCSFSVGNPVPAFSIHGKGKSTEVKAGKTLTMQVEWDGAKPKNTDVTWYVLGVDGKNPVFTASISDKGVLTGITAGKVKVLAVSKANPEKTADAEITVTAPEKGKNPEITAVRLTNAGDLKNKGLNLGKSYKLKTSLETSGTGKASSDAVAWISSDSNVATVSQKGVVKAVAPGKVTIIAVPRYTADISASPRDSVTFTVYAPVKKVKLDKTKLTVGTQTGSTYGKIGIAAVTPSDATNPAIMWTANNDNVQLAAVLKDGSPAEGSFAATGGSVITDAGYALAVKAVAPGVTKLKGITMDGSKKRVTCTVTVRGEVTGVKLLSGTARMKAGSGMTLKPILDINGISGSSTVKAEIKKYKTYKKYTDTSVSYRSSDTSVLTVKKNGKVKVNKNASGKSAIVYAVSADGRYKAEIKITVD